MSSGISDLVEAYVNNQSEMSKIDNSILKAKKDMFGTILDYGGWSLTPKGEKALATGRMGQYYDFNATLRSLELNKHGLMNYMKAKNLTMESLNNAIDQSISENDKGKTEYAKVISYVKGEDSGLTLETMSADQLEKFNNIISNLGNSGMSGFGTYLTETYKEEDVYAIEAQNN